MHCVGTAAIAAKHTDEQRRKFLIPIAEGRHITTLALSESGTGSHFWISETSIARNEEGYTINGRKQFVTNGGHADSYVLSTRSNSDEADGVFNMIVVDGHRKGMTWPSGWSGFGMRGNSSRGVVLENVHVPAANLLGAEGDELWFVFEIIAPFFLTAMSGTYLGIAQAALDIALTHVKTRCFSHSGERLQDIGIIQADIADMWMEVQNLRTTLYAACAAGDRGDTNALPHPGGKSTGCAGQRSGLQPGNDPVWWRWLSRKREAIPFAAR